MPVFVDEANLLTLSKIELEATKRDYETYLKKYAYCKTYKQLKAAHKNKKFLTYFYPIGEAYSKWISEIRVLASRKSLKSNIAIQTLADFKLNK